FYGGLYRDVNLICVNRKHFDLDYYGGSGLQITPIIHGKDAIIELKVYLNKPLSKEKLIYQIYNQENQLVCEEESDHTHISLSIQNAHLWQGRKDPYLYYAKVKLIEEDEVLDEVCSNFGIRSFFIDPDKGFFLNGESYPLHGVSRHQDRAGVGNALSKDNHQEDMELIAEMGANTIRLAHYQHDAYFYDLCDSYGMIVWAEIPYISKHMPTGNENTKSQMKELIIQNYNHPSIVVWGLSNEITISSGPDEDMTRNHEELNQMAHELDPTRLTVMACVSMLKHTNPFLNIPDIVSYNHYLGWYTGSVDMNGPWYDQFHKTHPNKPIGISEYGAEALNWHSSDPKQGDYTEEYQAYYHEEMIKQLFSRPFIWASHVWNMFDFAADARDEGGEAGMNHKGLVSFDRSYKKDSYYAYKAWLSDEKFVHICSKRYIDRVEDVTKVKVYSNMEEVELYANGELVEKKKSADHFFTFLVKNEGETKLLAKADTCIDEAIIRKVEEPNEEYILKDSSIILNWFDIEERKDVFTLND
ncbi:MAG: hypothetical protein IJ875_02755, partial [Solobacterium sp.]|nr:hypothetical protein [Solobacterium sp.]